MLVAVLLAPLAFSPCDFTNTNKGEKGNMVELMCPGPWSETNSSNLNRRMTGGTMQQFSPLPSLKKMRQHWMNLDSRT